MAPPTSVQCDICHQQFFKKSLPIHRKQCLIYYEKAFTPCPKCLRRVSNDEYEGHVSSCTTVRKTEHAVTVRPNSGVRKSNGSSPRVTNLESNMDEDRLVKGVDGRFQCGYCKRMFSSDRIAKHEQICATIQCRTMRVQGAVTEERAVTEEVVNEFVAESELTKEELDVWNKRDSILKSASHPECIKEIKIVSGNDVSFGQNGILLIARSRLISIQTFAGSLLLESIPGKKSGLKFEQQVLQLLGNLFMKLA